MIVKTVLDNGIRLLTEDIPALQSVSVGIWVGCGARVESETANGISHFVEHMLFKGTAALSAYEIASRIEATGGNLNAFTSKEQTSYYLKLPAYHLNLGLGVLAEMLSNPAFLEADIENEKGVVLSEIGQLEDSPEEYVYDIFEEALWREHPLRLPVLGNREAVKGFSGEALRDFFASHYQGRNIIISIAGALEHKKTIAVITELFGSLKQAVPKAGKTGAANVESPLPAALSELPFRVLRRQKTQQVNMVLGVPTFNASDPRRYALSLLNAVLGGSMSSRLFQEIREKRGLAYSIASFISPYSDAGFLGVCAGTAREDLGEVVACCWDECQRLAGERLSEKEVADAQGMLKGGWLLGMEGTDARMTKLARDEQTFGRSLAQEEIMEGIEALNAEVVQDLAQAIFNNGFSIAVLGDVRQRDWARALPFVS